MLQKLRGNNQKGFTLIELMIVIAIIGILAAIAVPQFLAYRIRSYNTAARAVAHTLKADQGNLNAELGEYGYTEGAPFDLMQVSGAQAESDTNNVTGDPDLRMPATAAAAGARLAGIHSVTGRNLAIGIALGDNMIADVINEGVNPDSFVIHTRHWRGDTAYGVDSDIENAMYSTTDATWAGLAAGGLAAAPVAPNISVDDFDGVASGSGGPSPNWLLSN